MKVKFGINVNKALTGAELYARIFQVTSLLPLLFIFAMLGYPAVISTKNVFSFLFEVGMMGIPRAESLALSFLYRLFSNELVIYAALLIIALTVGIVCSKLFRASYKVARTARIVFAALIAADIIFRIIPIRINLIMGIPAMIIGIIVRLACLVLIILDLRADRIESRTA